MKNETSPPRESSNVSSIGKTQVCTAEITLRALYLALGNVRNFQTCQEVLRVTGSEFTHNFFGFPHCCLFQRIIQICPSFSCRAGPGCCPPCLCGCKQILGNQHKLGVWGVMLFHLSQYGQSLLTRAWQEGADTTRCHPDPEKELWKGAPQERTPPMLCCQGLAVSITPTSHGSCISGWVGLQDRADTSRCHLGLCRQQKLLGQVPKGTGLRPPSSASPTSTTSLCLAAGSAVAATQPLGGSQLSGRVNGSVSAPDPAESCGSGFICCYCCFQVEN